MGFDFIDVYELDYEVLTKDEVNTLVENSNAGYMLYYNGPFKLNKEKIEKFYNTVKEIKDIDNLENTIYDYLYKGGILNYVE